MPSYYEYELRTANVDAYQFTGIETFGELSSDLSDFMFSSDNYEVIGDVMYLKNAGDSGDSVNGVSRDAGKQRYKVNVGDYIIRTTGTTNNYRVCSKKEFEAIYKARV